MMDKNQIRETIAKRVALELHDGDVVNLGIGLPTMVPNYLPKGVKLYLQSENGILGMGPKPAEGEQDEHIIDAGGGYASVLPDGATFSSAHSFEIIRGGHVDATILGAMQVDEEGNLANWMIPGKLTPGMGGAMDLVVGAKRVIVAMEHTQKGNFKILHKCNLPLTAAKQVNLIVTEMGVMEVTDKGIVLKEYNTEFGDKDTAVAAIQAATEATLIIDPNLKPMFF